jgi:zinc D-Ala-D-Ala carboxypeptidase
MSDHIIQAHYSKVPAEQWPWKHFSPAEMACRHCGEINITRSAMDLLEAFREAEGRPFIVHSAYRCPAHNRAVGGAKHSKHMEGIAFDVSMSNHDPHHFKETAARLGFNGIGTYPAQNFIHIDTRNTVARWGKPFPEHQPRFTPEPRARPVVKAAKEATATTGTIAIAHQGLQEVLTQTSPFLPTEWISYGALGLAGLGIGIVLYRMFRNGSD